MTSNIGSEVFQENGRSYDEKVEEVLSVLKRHFRPEFVNRIDDIVVFHPLEREHIRKIVDVQIKRLLKRVEDKKIAIDLTDEARDILAEQGYDPAFGARPLKRAIQQRIENPLSQMLLRGQFAPKSTVRVTVDPIQAPCIFLFS